jgi:hypothetical protein
VPTGSDILTNLPSIILGAYGLVAAVDAVRWIWRYRRRKRVAIHASREAWVASWYWPLMGISIMAVLGAFLALIFFVVGLGRSDLQALLPWFRVYFGVAFVALFLLGIDIVIVLRMHARSRPSPHPPHAENL